MISTQAKVVGGSYSMTSMTASALRSWRSKCSRWRSPLPLLVGPGMTEMQLGSHSAMRLGSEMRSKTSWMETPTVPVYVNETGRMGIIWRQRAAEMQRAAEGRQGGASVRQSLPPVAALCLIAALSVGERGLDYQGVARRGRGF